MTTAQEAAERLKLLEQDHAPDGWPAVQMRDISALLAERAGLLQTIRDEIDENLRLRELGGALPDENITAMTERLIRERAELLARVEAAERDAGRLDFLDKECSDVSRNGRHIYCLPGGLRAAIDAARAAQESKA